RDDQFAAPCGKAAVYRLLLDVTPRYPCRYGGYDLRVAPATNGCRAPADGDGSARTAKAVVAPDRLLIVWSRRAGGTDVGVVRHHLVAQRVDRECVTRCAHPWADPIAIHLADGRRSIRIGAVHVVVPCTRESGRRRHRRIHVLGLP